MDRELDGLLKHKLSRRDLFRNAGVAGIGLSALLDLPWLPATSTAQTPASTPKIGAQLIGKLEGPTTITDQSKFPKTFKEAPQVAELVKAGKLPPVKERIGEDPLVIKPVHEIGRYGGTIRRGFTGPGDWSAGVRFCGNDSLVHWDVTGTKPTPLTAKSWQFSDGDKTLTINLRRGMKWSDGKPFTADDFVFWFEDLYRNKDLNPSPSPYLTTKSGPAELEKVDTYTVRWKFKDPYWVFVSILTGPTGLGGQAHDSHVSALGGYAPAHYLKQFHPKYASKDELDQKAKDGKFDNWVNLIKWKADWGMNPELPVISPWRTTQGRNTATWTLERNPYYFAVDTEGNQLPYVDRVVLTLGENLEVINLRAIAGEYDWGERHLDLQKLPVFVENQQKGGYKVHLDPGGIGSDAALLCNQSYEADAEIAKWLTEVNFRRALSLGIDRDQLNETFWLGLGTPGSVACTEDVALQPRRRVPQALVHLRSEERQRHARQGRAQQEGRGGLPPAHRWQGPATHRADDLPRVHALHPDRGDDQGPVGQDRHPGRRVRAGAEPAEQPPGEQRDADQHGDHVGHREHVRAFARQPVPLRSHEPRGAALRQVVRHRRRLG